jgi:hypothetical protein
MRVVSGQFGKKILENNEPVVVIVTCMFLSRFESDKRWFGRVSSIEECDRLTTAYQLLSLPTPRELVIKFPFRYNRFSCYVSRNGVASSVYDIEQYHRVLCHIEMTNVNEHVSWKFKSINIIDV